MAESRDDLKRLAMKLKESAKAGLHLNILLKKLLFILVQSIKMEPAAEKWREG